jgi:hypothetical protein
MDIASVLKAGELRRTGLISVPVTISSGESMSDPVLWDGNELVGMYLPDLDGDLLIFDVLPFKGSIGAHFLEYPNGNTAAVSLPPTVGTYVGVGDEKELLGSSGSVYESVTSGLLRGAGYLSLVTVTSSGEGQTQSETLTIILMARHVEP